MVGEYDVGDDDMSGRYPADPSVRRFDPWPPDEPEPDDLNEPVDWMSYRHEQLYAMVHRDIDLADAGVVAGQWAHLASDLDDIGKDLRAALDKATEGWQGEGADAAQQALRRLGEWAEETAGRGQDVSSCVSRQVELAATARDTMPQPPPAPRIAGAGDGVTETMSAFSMGDYGSAPDMLTDRMPDREQQHRAHREAAEVMQRYQQQSTGVYSDVPTFVGPRDRSDRRRHEADVPAGDDNDRTSASAAAVPATSGPAAGGSGGDHGTARAPAPTTDRFGAAEQAGTSEARSFGSAPRAASPASSEGASSRPMGAMPMGGMRGCQGEEEMADKVAGYLEEDSDVWGLDMPVSPPVIGLDPPRDRGSGSRG